MFLFGQTKALESQVDDFLDMIARGALALNEGVKAYLGRDEEGFAARIKMVSELESRADAVRKSTEVMLYQNSLIPESRGDVLGLLENMDNIIDGCKQVLRQFEVQNPDIPESLHSAIIELGHHSAEAVAQVVAAARCYFRDTTQVKDHMNRVDFHEKEADQIGLRLQRRIYASELELARKNHLNFFVNRLESISDLAENVAERLAIATIKRSV